MTHALDLARPPTEVYAYVTQPARWHEWHPSSRSATATPELRTGDHFDEVVEVEPLAPLPLRLRRATRYKVFRAEPAAAFEVRGDTGDASLTIRYTLSPSALGTHFVRTLSFEARGLSRLWVPFLRPRMARVSEVALANLKRKLEGT